MNLFFWQCQIHTVVYLSLTISRRLKTCLDQQYRFDFVDNTSLVTGTHYEVRILTMANMKMDCNTDKLKKKPRGSCFLVRVTYIPFNLQKRVAEYSFFLRNQL